jgi:hypothetical protein
MTTYLATYGGEAFEVTRTFCSPQHRTNSLGAHRDALCRDDDRYEFDERCARCGDLIPACEPWRNLAATLKAEGWPK